MKTVLKNSMYCLICGLIAHPAGSPAQPQDRPPLVTRPAPSENAQFRLNINLAVLPVTVIDESSGKIVNGLRREQFTVLEDKAPQEIVAFSSDDAPCSIGLVFDNSGSMEHKIEKARLAMAHFFEVLNPQDEAFLMSFAGHPEIRAEFTSDFVSLRNTLLFTKPTGRTALIDAVYLGLQQMRVARNPRRAIVVISDGGDNNSRYGSRDLFDYAMEADVQIYALGVQPDRYGTFVLDAMADATGGLSVVDKLKALGDAMNTLSRRYTTVSDRLLLTAQAKRQEVAEDPDEGIPSRRAPAVAGVYPQRLFRT